MLKSKRLRTATAALFFVLLIFYYGPFESPQPLTPVIPSSTSPEGVNWRKFAYVQYVTNTAYLCNSVMLFESLFRLGTKADRLMMYPSSFVPGDHSLEGKLLAKARDAYGVKLVPIDVQRRSNNDREYANHFIAPKAYRNSDLG